jgi:hypothetical protein
VAATEHHDAATPRPDASAPDAAALPPDSGVRPDGGLSPDSGATPDSGAPPDSGVPSGDPAGRTEAEVCSTYRAGLVENATATWTPGPDRCSPGSMPRAAIDDTLRRIAMYRWLVGLGPVSDDAELDRLDQACAIMEAMNGGLNHMPPPSWICYSADGASAAMQSNLALGARSAARAIDLFMVDSGVASLGHRRWVLNGPLGPVGVGFADSASCLAVFDMNGVSSRLWTAYPNPGPAPIDTARGTWSFHSNSIGVGQALVSVIREVDGSTVSIDLQHLPYGYGPDSVSWELIGEPLAAGARYRVTVTGLMGRTSSVVYEVWLVGC